MSETGAAFDERTTRSLINVLLPLHGRSCKQVHSQILSSHHNPDFRNEFFD